MESEHFIGKVAQKALIEKEGKILIVLSKEDVDVGVWELPGGRLHRNEFPADGLSREIQEELGVTVTIKRVAYVEQYLQGRTGAPHLLLAYHVTLADPEQPFVFGDGEVTQVKWITAEELGDQKIFDNCERALRAYFGVR